MIQQAWSRRCRAIIQPRSSTEKSQLVSPHKPSNRAMKLIVLTHHGSRAWLKFTDEGPKGSWACLHLRRLLDHCLNGSAEKLRRQNQRIKEKALLFRPDICQVHLQMSLRNHHGCHWSANGSGGLFSGTESKICGAVQLSHLIRG